MNDDIIQRLRDAADLLTEAADEIAFTRRIAVKMAEAAGPAYTPAIVEEWRTP